MFFMTDLPVLKSGPTARIRMVYLAVFIRGPVVALFGRNIYIHRYRKQPI
jgi:hypothetical protein